MESHFPFIKPDRIVILKRFFEIPEWINLLHVQKHFNKAISYHILIFIIFFYLNVLLITV